MYTANGFVVAMWGRVDIAIDVMVSLRQRRGVRAPSQLPPPPFSARVVALSRAEHLAVLLTRERALDNDLLDVRGRSMLLFTPLCACPVAILLCWLHQTLHLTYLLSYSLIAFSLSPYSVL